MKKDIFHAIADPTRRAIISLIAAHAMTPGAIAGHFQCSRQAVSKHIKVLGDCKLLKQELNGREIYYHLNVKKMKEVADWLEPFKQMWESRLDRLDNLLTNLKPRK